MFTPGFRIFGLFSLFGIISAFIYGVATGDTSGDDYFGIIDTEAIKGALSLGWEGGIGEHLGYVVFVFLTLTALGIGIALVAFRDADPKAVAELKNLEIAPRPESPANRNFWPVVMAFGLSVIVVGLITDAAITVMGIILVGVAILEWAVFAWSERLTGDPETNKSIRSSIMAPVEIPVLGIAGMAVLALGASRVFLAVSEANAVWVGTGIAVAIFFTAILLVAKPKISRPIIASLLVLGAIGIIVAGIASASIGAREIHHHDEEDKETTATDEVLVGPDTQISSAGGDGTAGGAFEAGSTAGSSKDGY